jgi:hypothetical protein
MGRQTRLYGSLSSGDGDHSSLSDDDWGVSWLSSRGHHPSIAQDATRIITSSGSCLDQRAIVVTLPAKIAERPLTNARGISYSNIFFLGDAADRGANTASSKKGHRYLPRIFYKNARDVMMTAVQRSREDHASIAMTLTRE